MLFFDLARFSEIGDYLVWLSLRTEKSIWLALIKIMTFNLYGAVRSPILLLDERFDPIYEHSREQSRPKASSREK